MHEAILLIERMNAAVSIIGGDNPEDRHCMGELSGFRCRVLEPKSSAAQWIFV
jgi:hypothetical protein